MTLNQIATIKPGYPFRGKIATQQGGNAIVVQMRDVSIHSGINWQTCVPTQLTGKRQPDLLHRKDILFIARGNRNHAVLVGPTLENRSMPVVVTPHFYVISLHNSNIIPEFLVWYLNQQPCQTYFQQNAEGSNTKNIRRRLLEETPIILPPLVKQQNVVNIAHTHRQQQVVANQLLQNGQQLQTAIAMQLVKQFGAKGSI